MITTLLAAMEWPLPGWAGVAWAAADIRFFLTWVG